MNYEPCKAYIIARKKTLTQKQIKELLLQDFEWLNSISWEFDYLDETSEYLLFNGEEKTKQRYVDIISAIVFSKTRPEFCISIGDYYLTAVISDNNVLEEIFDSFISSYCSKNEDLIIHKGWGSHLTTFANKQRSKINIDDIIYDLV